MICDSCWLHYIGLKKIRTQSFKETISCWVWFKFQKIYVKVSHDYTSFVFLINSISCGAHIFNKNLSKSPFGCLYIIPQSKLEWQSLCTWINKASKSSAVIVNSGLMLKFKLFFYVESNSPSIGKAWLGELLIST